MVWGGLSNKSSSCPLPFPSNNATVITHAERERDSKLSTKTKTKTKTHLDRFVSDLFPCRRQLLPSSHFWRVGYIDEAFFLCVRIIFKVWVLSYNQRWQHNQQELVQITITSSSFFLMATMSYKQALADQLNLKHRQVEV